MTGSGANENGVLVFRQWLPYRLFIGSGRIGEILEDFYRPRFGLSRSAWRTLAVVSGRQGMSAGDIGRATGFDGFTVSRALGQLIDLALIDRRPAPGDKRFIAVRPTRKGWDVYCEIAVLAARLEQLIFGTLSPREREFLFEVADHMETAGEKLAASGWAAILSEAEQIGTLPVLTPPQGWASS